MRNEKVKTSSIYIRLSTESKARLQAAARAAGYTLSAFVRLAVEDAADGVLAVIEETQKQK